MTDDYIPYNRPSIEEAEIEAVVETLRSGWITTGPRAAEFERRFAAYTGAGHAVGLSSATAALHLALLAAGVGPGDEVIVPVFTFAACAHVVVHLGATPIFVDSSPDDLNLDPAAVERAVTPRTRALMVVHYAGQPARMDELLAIAARHNLFVLEDAAHAVGARYRGRPAGSLGDAAAFSFYATKNLATGEGGMLTTSRDDVAETVRLYALHGMSRDAWKRYGRGGSWFYEVVAPGYKYNLSDIQAALGLAQLERLDERNARRALLAGRMTEALSDCDAAEPLAVRPEVDHAWHLYVIRLCDGTLTVDRNRFIEELEARGIATSVHFIPLHLHPYYREMHGTRAGDFPVAESSFERAISLPLYPSMSEADADRVAEAVRDVARTYAR
ncbi:MAG: DegT/DnrJ/EryC1/StrS family aminotransferase [Dehalococcoidia bacterium]